jgi:hypothetical protein
MNIKEADRIYKSELSFGEKYNDERELFIADCIGAIIEWSHLDKAPQLKARCLSIIEKRHVVFHNEIQSEYKKKLVTQKMEQDAAFGQAAF